MSAQAQRIVINIVFENLQPSHNQAYIYQAYGPWFDLLDSIEIQNNSISLQLEASTTRSVYKVSTDKNHEWPFIVGNKGYSISINHQTQVVNYQNTTESQAYQQYLDINEAIVASKQLFDQARQKVKNRNTSAYQRALQKMLRGFDSLNNVRNTQLIQLAAAYPNTYASKLAGTLAYTESITAYNYFKRAEFTDAELLTSNILYTKTLLYFEHFVSRRINDWLKNAYTLLGKAGSRTPAKEIVYASIIELFATSAPSHADMFAKAYTNEFEGSTRYNSVLAPMPPGPPQIGEPAPDIELTSPEGKTIKLSALKGQFVLIDFWASWCRPCRVESPNLVSTYNAYKNKGFTIFSVSLDSKREAWLKAIKKDNLTWHHVSDLQGWSSAGALAYQVRAIPATFLVNKEGIIIAKNLRGSTLKKELEKHLK